jgi:hypothetical protein
MSVMTGLEQEDTIVRQSSVVQNNPGNSMLTFLSEALTYFEDSQPKVESFIKTNQTLLKHKENSKDCIQKQIMGENEDLRK